MYSEDKAVTEIDMPAASRLVRKPISSRPTPYGRENFPSWKYDKFTPRDPDAPGRWAHDKFGSQIKGGNLAFLLGVDPSAPGSSSRRLTAEEKIAARNGGGGSKVGKLDLESGKDLLAMEIEEEQPVGKGSLLGRVEGASIPRQPRQQQQQQQQPRGKVASDFVAPPRPLPQVVPVSTPVQPKPNLSIKGKSSRNTIDVKNLALGTTVEDVVMTFASFGTIINSKLLPSPRDSVSVQLEFTSQDAASTSISNFHNALADGRQLSVTFAPLLAASPASAPPLPTAPRAAPSAPASRAFAQRREQSSGSLPAPGLLGRLGLQAGGGGPKANGGGRASTGGIMDTGTGGDLMDGIGASSKMYSDSISDARSASSAPSGPRGSNGRRGGGRAGGGGRPSRNARGVGMEVD